MAGPLAVAYCLGDAPPAAKVLMGFAKETDLLTVRGAILGSSLLDGDGVKGLADLPPREVLLAQLLGVVQSPMSSLVSTIQAPMRELVQVLHARAAGELPQSRQPQTVRDRTREDIAAADHRKLCQTSASACARGQTCSSHRSLAVFEEIAVDRAIDRSLC